MRSQLTIWIVLQFFCESYNTFLLINVRNQGGEIIKESLSSNTTEDVITLEFQRSDGTLVTQLIDFKNEVQIIKALVLGEMEQGQNQFQTMCFVTHFYDKDFISSDAMSKLRQKNRCAVRVAEINRNYANYTMNYFLDVFRSSIVSKHIVDLCSEAAGSTFTRREDVKKWARRRDSPEAYLLTAVHNFTIVNNDTPAPINNTKSSNVLSRCADTSIYTAPCTCSLELCISWYPCGLKFCKTKVQRDNGSNSSNNSKKDDKREAKDLKELDYKKLKKEDEEKEKQQPSYRCGIKTCKKCYNFSYYSKLKENCLWDE